MAKPISPLPPAPTPPIHAAPVGACDTHVHLLAAPEESPLYAGRTEDTTTTYADYLDRYRAHLTNLGCTRCVIVQSIFYGTDNTITARAVADMGDGFKGIGLLPDGASEQDFDDFADWNMKGVRLNYVHGGVLTWDGARAMAPALADRNMHIQILMNTDKHMAGLATDIAALPVPVVFDHIGWPNLTKGVNDAGFQTLCNALKDGNVYVKLSGLYRLCDAPYNDVDEFVAALVEANPERCLWGSDWPHIMLNGAQMPQASTLWDAFHRVVTNTDTRTRVLVDNPAALYGF